MSDGLCLTPEAPGNVRKLKQDLQESQKPLELRFAQDIIFWVLEGLGQFRNVAWGL